MTKVLHTRIYKVWRKSHGKTVAVYRGYYTLEKNGPRIWKSLGTPDKVIAEKRIMEFAMTAQREQEGLIAPRSERETSSKGLLELISEYRADLVSRDLVKKHIHNTITRITMKDDAKRAVPLRKELAEQLRELRPAKVDPTQPVFWWRFPTYDLLRSHLNKAGIERKDGLGRVVHFHSFRKTLQSLGVAYGINQRAAQEILGHTDANLTAQAYTDVPSLQLHDEIAKLPWIPSDGSVAQHSAQNSGVSSPVVSLADIMAKLELLTQATGTDGVGHSVALSGTPCQIDNLAARYGDELTTICFTGGVFSEGNTFSGQSLEANHTATGSFSGNLI